MAIRCTLELLLSERSVAILNAYDVNISEIAIVAIQEELVRRAEIHEHIVEAASPAAKAQAELRTTRAELLRTRRHLAAALQQQQHHGPRVI